MVSNGKVSKKKKKKGSDLLENKWDTQYLCYYINPINDHTINTECNTYCTWQEIMPNKEKVCRTIQIRWKAEVSKQTSGCIWWSK